LSQSSLQSGFRHPDFQNEEEKPPLARIVKGCTFAVVAKRILVIAYDPSLLLTRRLLLEQAGYEVITAEGFVAACEACEAQKEIDLAIIGHTVSQRDKEPIVARLRQNNRAPILALVKPHEASVRGADLSVETEPTVLLAAVRNLIGK
jgi:DNA-binding response OmpR family regulator